MDRDVLNGTDDDVIRAQQARDLGHPLDPGKESGRRKAGKPSAGARPDPADKPVRASRKGVSGSSPDRR